MGRTIVSEDGRFEWDEEKDAKNRIKHGIAFNEVLRVFDDPDFLEGYDSRHSFEEDRYYGIGRLHNFVVMIVFYTERGGRIRIMSARQADADDQEVYYDNLRQHHA